MSRLALITLAVCLLAPAAAQAYQFEIVTPIADQTQVQRAISFQLNRQVARHWTINPVSFEPGGIPIVIVPLASAPSACGEVGLTDSSYGGCHIWDGHQATIYVQNLDRSNLTRMISHEVIETELNMRLDASIEGQEPEAADPVEHWRYQVLGVQVSDFVYARWYLHNPRGPWDEIDETAGPGHSSAPPLSARS